MIEEFNRLLFLLCNKYVLEKSIRIVLYINKVTTTELACIITTRQFVSNLPSFAKFASKKDYSKKASGPFCEKLYKIFKTNYVHRIKPNRSNSTLCSQNLQWKNDIKSNPMKVKTHRSNCTYNVQPNLQYYKVNNKTN